MCPTLAVTTQAINGIGMGLAATFVLVCSNFVIAITKNYPDKVRIAVFIVIIATFVTIVDLVMEGFFYEIHKALGIFIPLIVVNCIILGRAEAFASKNPVLNSIADGLGWDWDLPAPLPFWVYQGAFGWEHFWGFCWGDPICHS